MLVYPIVKDQSHKKTLLEPIIKSMEVTKRDGRHEPVSFDKILARIEAIKQKHGLDRINPIEVTKETIQGLCHRITTEELDIYAALKCADKIIDDPQYNNAAGALTISNLHKTTSNDFMEVTNSLYTNTDNYGKHNPLVTSSYVEYVKQNIDLINSTIDYERDYLFDFFGIKTLEKAYLLRTKHVKNSGDKIIAVYKKDDGITRPLDKTVKKGEVEIQQEKKIREKQGRIVERPQHMIMRLALAIHHDDIDEAMETYKFVSLQHFIHASPTLYNAASHNPQMSSCFLSHMQDSIEGIFDETICDIAKISKWSGGIGVHLQDIRANGSLIRGTNGVSDGIVPLIKVLNSVAKYVNQGGRRNGAIAVYLEPWHADIFEFCDLRKNTGIEELRARDIFLALWIPDIFMQRVEEEGYWSLMCPDECPGLTDKYGDEFNELYIKYEKEGRYKKQVKAEDLWYRILSSQIETGMPYMLYKDHANRKSNQKNIDIIKSSNLCTEIIQVSNKDEIAVCNLASICLQRFIEIDEAGKKFYNFDKLRYVAGIITRNLNKIIDINYYPVPKAKVSNMRHRPLGIGVQGLADLFCLLDIPYDSEQARDLNKQIFETIYYGCLQASVELAKKYGPYETFNGSPFSKGELQFHMWGLDQNDLLMNWDWNTLINDIKQYGTRNSLLTTVMPTASTSQICGSNEATEPFTTNLYTRTTLAGEYIVVNRHLVEKLIKLDLWNQEVKNELMYDNGSIQNIECIPQNIKDIFKTAFEMKTRPLVQLAIDRGPFIDHSQSMNIFNNVPDFDKLTSSHFFSWRNGLKTGMYYLRSQPAVDAIKFGLDPEFVKKIEKKRGKNKKQQQQQQQNNDVVCWNCSG